MASPTSPRWAAPPAGLGDLLRAARIHAGLSRDRLALAVGASKGLIQGVEDGLRPPSATIAGRLSEVLALDEWQDAVVRAAAVDDAALRTRRGVRHARPRAETCAKSVPSPT